MSRIGKKPILIPQNVKVEISGRTVKVSGPKGELSFEFDPEIKVEEKEGKIFVNPSEGAEDMSPIWGLTRVLISNMITGITEGYEKKLEIEGVGFKAAVEGENLVLNIGFSHQVKIKAPKNIKFTVEKNVIIVSGIDKALVGQIAADIRKAKPAEPYKGKGIKYQGEIIRRKEGKKAVSTSK